MAQGHTSLSQTAANKHFPFYSKLFLQQIVLLSFGLRQPGRATVGQKSLLISPFHRPLSEDGCSELLLPVFPWLGGNCWLGTAWPAMPPLSHWSLKSDHNHEHLEQEALHLWDARSLPREK